MKYTITLPVKYLLFILVMLSNTLFAQKKITTSLDIVLHKSLFKDIIKTHGPEDNILSLEYYSRKKFTNPYISIKGIATYPVAKQLKISFKSGAYIYFSEMYTSYPAKTRVAIPVELNLAYEWPLRKNTIGLSSDFGFLFFDINELTSRYRNAYLGNLALSYSVGKTGSLKLGLENQIDKASFNLKAINSYSKNESFKFCTNRISSFIGYSFHLN